MGRRPRYNKLVPKEKQNPPPWKGAGFKPEPEADIEARISKQIDMIAAGLEAGLGYCQAARAAGVNPRTYYNWLEYAKKGKQPYLRLFKKIRWAKERGIAVLAGRIMSASRKDWKAAAWMLERRDPEKYGKTERHHVDHTGTVNQTVAISNMTTEQRLARIKELEQKIAEAEYERQKQADGNSGADNPDDQDSARTGGGPA